MCSLRDRSPAFEYSCSQLILVREDEMRDRGMSLEAAKQQCPEHLRSRVFKALVIDWHRMRDFQRISLLKILEQLFSKFQRPRLYFSNTLVEHLQKKRLHALRRGCTHHLYYSKHNLGAEALVAELIELVNPHRVSITSCIKSRAASLRPSQLGRASVAASESGRISLANRIRRKSSIIRLPQRARLMRPSVPLRATNDADSMMLAGRFLLLLNSDTWTSRSAMDLVDDLYRAVRFNWKNDF